MCNQQDNLGVKVRSVPGSRIAMPIRGPNTLLCSASLGVVWVEDDCPHENVSHTPRRRAGDQGMGEDWFSPFDQREGFCKRCKQIKTTLAARWDLDGSVWRCCVDCWERANQPQPPIKFEMVEGDRSPVFEEFCKKYLDPYLDQYNW